MNGDRSGDVVVGYDASPHAEEALGWAAEEAARRGAALRVVQALASGPTRRADELAVSVATNRATERHPELHAKPTLLDVDVVEGIIEQSRGAAILVLGRCGHNRYASLPLGSVSRRLVAHAPCPTVVVGNPNGETGVPTTAAGPVVLGVQPGESPTVVDFAFESAALRGTPLRVTSAQRVTSEAEFERGELEELLLHAAKRRPDVEWQLDLRIGSPADALVRASADACLLVTGLRLPRQRYALPVGRVTQRVLHRALCPVAVVPHGRVSVSHTQAGG